MQATLRPRLDIMQRLYSAQASICFQLKIVLCKKDIGAPSIIIQYQNFFFPKLLRNIDPAVTILNCVRQMPGSYLG